MNDFNCKPKILVDYENKEYPFLLENDVRYKSSLINGRLIRIYLNKGFPWNGADIPRVLWRLIGSRYDVEFLPASMIHDYCCKNKQRFTVKESSIMFRDILVKYGKVSKIKANIMMIGVWLYQNTQKGWKE